jgi:hypothetical protein
MTEPRPEQPPEQPPEHRPEKPPAHRPENNQQPEHTEDRPENHPDPGLVEMYKDSQYVLEDADGLRLDPDPAAPAPPIPDPGPRITFDQADPNPSQLGVDDELSPTEAAQSWPYGEVSPTEEAKGATAHDGPDPNAAAQPRADTSDAHQPGGFGYHPSYSSQWPYVEIRPEEGVEAWPYGEVSPTEEAVEQNLGAPDTGEAVEDAIDDAIDDIDPF